MLCETEGIVAYACLHTPLRLRGAPTSLYALALCDGETYFSRCPVRVYDSAACRLPGGLEILPGSRVRLKFNVDPSGAGWMTAVQVISVPEDDADFAPVEQVGAFVYAG